MRRPGDRCQHSPFAAHRRPASVSPIPVKIWSPMRRPDPRDRIGSHTLYIVCASRRSNPSWPGRSTPRLKCRLPEIMALIVEVLEGSPAEKGGLDAAT